MFSKAEKQIATCLIPSIWEYNSSQTTRLIWEFSVQAVNTVWAEGIEAGGGVIRKEVTRLNMYFLPILLMGCDGIFQGYDGNINPTLLSFTLLLSLKRCEILLKYCRCSLQGLNLDIKWKGCKFFKMLFPFWHFDLPWVSGGIKIIQAERLFSTFSMYIFSSILCDAHACSHLWWTVLSVLKVSLMQIWSCCSLWGAGAVFGNVLGNCS